MKLASTKRSDPVPPLNLLWTLLLISVTWLAGACSSPSPVGPASMESPEQQPVVQGLRRALELAPERRAELEARLAAAIADWDAQRSEMHAVWVGRRLAYLGLYEAAVDWYTAALGEYPASYRLWRHRGHRQISIRAPHAAIESFERARELAAGHANELEPDGAPNALGIPVSSTHGNIDYHLALAHYCLGEFDAAAEAWQRCFAVWAQNDDARVASGHWLYTTLVRLGRGEDAQAVLAQLPAGLEIIENYAYRDLIELYAGRADVDELLGDMDDPNQSAAATYGIARWLMARGDAASRERGEALLAELAAQGAWASFGRIAAEYDLHLAPRDR